MAFPQLTGGTTALRALQDGATHTVNLPSGSSGLLLVVASFNSSQALAQPTVTVNPWSDTTLFQTSYPADYITLWVGWHRATGSETGTTLTTSQLATSVVRAYRINGEHASSSPEAATAVTASTLNPDPPSLTPSWGAEDTTWLAPMCHRNATSDITSWPASYTSQNERAGGDASSPGASALQVMQGMASRELNIATENPGTYTIGGATARVSIAQTVAIRPAAGAPPAADPTSHVLGILY